MISKLITGNGFGGAVRYSTKYGKDPDGTLHKLLSVSGVTFDYDENGNLTINPRKVGWDFRQQTLGYHPDTKNYRPIQKPVYHWILSWKEGERKIPPKEMREVANEFMKRIGFTNTQYVISAHYDKDNQHLHIVANIVNNEGKRIVTKGLVEKGHIVAADMTRERGYEWGDPATKKTVESAKKPHEKVRYIIKPIIFEARRTSLTEDELVAKLKKSNINTIIRQAEDGKRGGISFAFTYEGVEHTFRGSSVDRKLSYGNIVKQLKNNRDQAEKSLPKENILKLYPAAIEVGQFVTGIYMEYKELGIDFQRGQEINDMITQYYARLSQHFSDLRALKLEDSFESEEMHSLRTVGVILMNTFPILGFSMALMSHIMKWVYQKKNEEEKRELIEKINLTNNTIIEYKAIRSKLNQEEKLLMINGVDLKQVDVFDEPTKPFIEKVDKILIPYREEIKDEGQKKRPLPDKICVSRENYESISLPEGFAINQFGSELYLNNTVIPQEGLILVKDRKTGQYNCLNQNLYKADQERIKGNIERYNKYNQSSFPKRGNSKTKVRK